jgi:hypothetical protein
VGRAIEIIDRRLRLCRIWHLDKAKPSGAAGVPIRGDAGLLAQTQH